MSKGTNEIDALIGLRIRLRRQELGLSQSKLGDALGITFQQIQKYENGRNRLPASRLAVIAKMLEVPSTFFFVDDGVSLDWELGDVLFNGDRHLRKLLAAFVRVKDPVRRQAIVKIVEAVIDAIDSGEPVAAASLGSSSARSADEHIVRSLV